MYSIRVVLILLLTLGFSLASFSQSLTVRHNKVIDPKEELLLNILKLVVRQVEPGAQFEATAEPLQQLRAEEELLNGQLDVVWGSSAPAREEKLWGVRIPVIKGLLGHRIFIIKPENQHLFDEVDSLDDLKRLTAGQGIDWGDRFILEAAGLPVETANKYESLFHMVDGERFDYFPRAVHEPFVEIAGHPDLDLTIEKNLLLVYPLTMNFYVAPGDEKMHHLIQQGFDQAIANGSYDEFFFNHPMVRDALEKSNIENRRLIRIGNPNLHPDTRLERKEYWLDLF